MTFSCYRGVNRISVPLSYQDKCLEETYPLYQPASLVAQMVKYLPATQKTWVQSLDWENPLEKGKVTRSNILACRIPWTERTLAGYSPCSHKESDMT